MLTNASINLKGPFFSEGLQLKRLHGYCRATRLRQVHVRLDGGLYYAVDTSEQEDFKAPHDFYSLQFSCRGEGPPHTSKALSSELITRVIGQNC